MVSKLELIIHQDTPDFLLEHLSRYYETERVIDSTIESEKLYVIQALDLMYAGMMERFGLSADDVDKNIDNYNKWRFTNDTGEYDFR